MTDSGDAPPGERDCAFCAIIRGELSATRILETEHLLAFLDHRPLFRGHTLLVPKQHMRLLSDLPADLAAEFLTTAQRLERAIEDGLGVSGSMILVNNVVSQSVPHLHLHVIPREFKDGLRFWLGPRHPYNDENPAQAYADKIRGALLSGGYTPTPQAPHLRSASVRSPGCAGWARETTGAQRGSPGPRRRSLAGARFASRRPGSVSVPSGTSHPQGGLAGSLGRAGTGLGGTFWGNPALAGQSRAKVMPALESPGLHPGRTMPHLSPESPANQDIWV